MRQRRLQARARHEALAAAERLGEAEGHALAEAVEVVAAARVSLVTDVMRTSGSPQATTQLNGCRSLSTLTAKPWVVTPRETCRPIEAILRSSIHTPV